MRPPQRRNVLLLAVSVVLVIACIFLGFRAQTLGARAERYRPMAEKLRAHCAYVAGALRSYRKQLGIPSLHKAAAANIDVFIESTEQIEICLDDRPSNLIDPMQCIMNSDDDTCRRTFLERFLDAIPERYERLEQLD